MFRWFQSWRLKRWIKSAGVDPVRLFTAEDERALVQILALLASEKTPQLAATESSDSAAAGSADEAEHDGSGYLDPKWEPAERYWYSDDEYSQDVCVKRWGPI
jgi:hypothetical protein